MRDFSIKLMMGLVLALTLPGCSDTSKKPADSLAGYRPDYQRGQYVYSAFCGECHDTGKGGAPLLDDAEEWDNRALGFPTLLQNHASRGFLGMPEKGGHAELSERNIADAVHYMIRRIEADED